MTEVEDWNRKQYEGECELEIKHFSASTESNTWWNLIYLDRITDELINSENLF